MSTFAELDAQSVVTKLVFDGDISKSSAPQKVSGSITKDGAISDLLDGKDIALGMVYDAKNDRFINPQRFPSWAWDEKSLDWLPPKPCPQDGNLYRWNEAKTDWVRA